MGTLLDLGFWIAAIVLVWGVLFGVMVYLEAKR